MERYSALILAIAGAITALWAGVYWPWALVLAVPLSLLALLGIYDLLQQRHSLLRNYPILAHMRWLFEGIRPEIRQYLMEGDGDAVPFTREQRSLVYQRAKEEAQALPFGTQRDVYSPEYQWFPHSMTPCAPRGHDFRLTVGGPQCRQPYSLSLLNISAMSFGALSANAILALNKGAAMGGFAHDTGEGSVSRYHRRHGGDLIWEIGSGYFGCRDEKGRFSPERFAERAGDPQIRMIEIKLSQGAKPGHGGVLPAAKVTPEIAEARGIPVGQTCVSPAAHTAFSTPVELMRFIARLRELSGGKPVGFKLCIGHYWEFMAIVKAMRETGILADFIVVDGKEGGTGSAPPEFSNSLGTPLREGLSFVHNALTGAGLRNHIRIGASGKIVSGADIAAALALGADWCNSARGFMFALGCIQARSCHNNRCPSGVATQDPWRQRALVPEDKARRVANFHRNTLAAFGELLGALGLKEPRELTARHLMLRGGDRRAMEAWQYYPAISPGALLEDDANALPGEDDPIRRAWFLARAESFSPLQP